MACYEYEDTHFNFMTETILATENKRPNILTKDIPIAFIIQEVPRVSGVLCQKM